MGDVRGGSVAVCGDGRAVSCMYRWFEVVCLVFSAMLPRPTECGTWPTNILARLETPTSSSSPAASLVPPDDCCRNLFHLTSSASGDVLADYSHRGRRRCVHQLLSRPRSTRQQVADIHCQCCVVRTPSCPSRAATPPGVCAAEPSRASLAGPNAPSTTPCRSIVVLPGRPTEGSGPRIVK